MSETPELNPLTLLRQYHMKKKEIVERDGQIIFGDYAWPKNANTNYQTFRSGKKGAPKEYYTLESVLYLLKHKQLPHPVYIEQATAENVIPVRRPDRKALLAFLNGEKRTTPAIDTSVPLAIPVQLKRRAEDGSENNSAKRPHLDSQRDEEELVARLDARKEVFLQLENVKSLSEAMSDEKIAAIKAKRLAKKSSTEPFLIPLPLSEKP